MKIKGGRKVPNCVPKRNKKWQEINLMLL
jgi:hypothetical protein